MERLLQLSDRVVDLETGRIDRGGELRPLELRLLRYLADRPGQAVSKEELLVRVWGYAQTTRTRTLYSTWHRMRTVLEADPAAPAHLETVAGAGLRLVGVTATAPEPDTNLVPTRDRFVGRASELALLRGTSARLVTLTGPGGSGKTRLAREFAWGLAGRLPGTWFCDLSDGRDDAAGRITQTLGLDPGSALSTALARRGEALLVLDQLGSADAADLVAECLDRAPRLRLVATGRDPIGVQGEVVVTLGSLAPADALDLFVERARQRRADFAPTSDLPELVDLLDGLPLAIEIAAAHAAVLGTRAVRTTLEAGGDLESERRDRPARHRSLEAVVAWSWAGLPEWGRGALGQLAAFARSFTPVAAEAVLRLPPGAPPPATALVRLVDQGFVAPLPTDPGRFALTRSVRGFVEARGVDPEAVARHLARYAELAGSVALAEIPRALHEDGPEVDELLLAATRSLASPGSAPVGLVVRAVEIGFGWGRAPQAEALLERALTEPVPDALALRLRANRLFRRMNRLDLDAIAREAEGLPQDAAAAGLPSVALRVELDLAHHFANSADDRAAEAALARAGRWRGELAGPPELLAYHDAMAENVRAVLASNRSRSPLEAYGRALAELERAGLRDQAAIARMNVGRSLADAGRVEEGERELRRAVEEIPLSWRSSRGLALAQLARVVAQRGDTELARAAADEAVALLESVGNLRLVAFARLGRAEVQRRRGAFDAALADLRDGEHLARELGQAGMWTEAVMMRARVAAEAGHADASDRARLGWEAALDLGIPEAVADAAEQWVDRLAAEGRWAEALAVVEAGFARCPDPGLAGPTLGFLRAELRRRTGDPGGALLDLRWAADGAQGVVSDRLRLARAALVAETDGPAEAVTPTDDPWGRVLAARLRRALGEPVGALPPVPGHQGLLRAAIAELEDGPG